MNMEKNEIIKKELSKYKKIYKDVDKDRKPFTEKLYNQAAFMVATLEELQYTINEEGPVITSVNGNGFETTMEHPAQKSYNTMIKNYNATIKALIDLLPNANGGGDEFTEFLSRDKK